VTLVNGSRTASIREGRASSRRGACSIRRLPAI
jgi:hypothetical protein